jgi:lipoprotein signal peptidase
MLSSNGGISSKRVSAFFTLINIIILTYIAALHSPNKQTPEYMFNTLSLIVGGGLGLTVIERIFDKKGDSKKQKDEEIE